MELSLRAGHDKPVESGALKRETVRLEPEAGSRERDRSVLLVPREEANEGAPRCGRIRCQSARRG